MDKIKLKLKGLPFRLGTTSYILPDEILPNVRYLAGLIDDIELVLFEADDGLNNLPDIKTIAKLKQIARQYQLSYTVHLPLDLRLAGADGEQHLSLIKARKVIELTRDLQPHAYVLHLDGREVLHQNDPDSLQKWNHQALLALRQVSEWTAGSQLLSVENLEHYPPRLWDDVIQRAGVSRCVDIGHLWVDKLDPLDFLKPRIGETRVIHLHGIGERDHQSLCHVAPAELKRVMDFILQADYKGVLTMEIFGEDDFFSSLEALSRVLGKMEDGWKNN